MKLNKDRKIIYEDDIILSDGSTTLSERFTSAENHLLKLDGEVKWLYKYGGTGSGSGGSGGGSGSTNEFSIYATLANIQLTGSTITLSSTGQYSLNIRINKPGGLTYYVRYINNNSRSAQIKLDSTNSWSTTVSLNLTTNSTLIVQATNEDNETKQVTCSYITTPYTISTALRSNTGSVWSKQLNIAKAASDGVKISTDYQFYISTLSINYSIVFNGETVAENVPITDTSGTFEYTIPSDLFVDTNAGYYSGYVTVNIVANGQLVSEVRDFSMLLIPEDLYLLFGPAAEGALIYNDKIDEPYEFQLGSNSFTFVVYDGNSTSSNYSVTFVINGNTDGARTYTGVQGARELSIDLFSSTEGWNTIEATLTNTLTNKQYTHTYYYYVGASAVDIEWPSSTIWHTQNYYRAGEVTSAFNKFNGSVYTTVNSLDKDVTISGLGSSRTTTADIINTHIAISLQLSSVNDDNTPLFTFKGVDGSTLLTLTPTAIQLTSAILSSITLKKESSLTPESMSKYQLIDIYSTYRTSVGSTPYCEISIYLDGILEASLPALVGSYLNVALVVINPFNGYVNLLDVEYKQGGDTAETDADYDVYQYYLKYANNFLQDSSVINQLQIAETIKTGFDFDASTGRVATTTAVADTIARLSDVPTLMLEVSAANTTIEAIMTQIEQSYTEASSSNFNFTLNKIYWHPGKDDAVSLAEITGKPEQGQFQIKAQGSSTKSYRVKNFELTLASTNSNEMYLFSPNFSSEDTTTFLPEQSFTLKADVVDSSHSNNTAAGKFVNKVTTQFYNAQGKYGAYIKNCLDGFPFLLYVNIVKTDSVTGALTSACYYLGIYNFNLGRASSYNLGYKPLTPFEESEIAEAGSGFSFFTISNPTQNSAILSGLGVAEILGNSGYFDFSQYDPTILYPVDNADETYMYGDLVYGSDSDTLKLALNAMTKQVSRAGGYIFDYLKKNFGKPDEKYVKERTYNGVTQSANQVPDYRVLYTKAMVSGSPVFTASSTTLGNAQITDLTQLIVEDLDSETLNYIDYQSLSEYYTICMVLGLVDSVQKNLNLKTWTIDKLNVNKPATWYIAFYDMDTCLGVNNAGQDINPLAFSDYWSAQYTQVDSSHVIPQTARIYSDFSPSSLGSNGYDTPSSYLFAVAKYARLFFNSDESNGDVTKWFPQELYAKWRSPIINDSDNQGILVNADTFVDRFFANNLGGVNKALVSYNYRSKYFKITGTGWVTRDYEKFNGTRITKVREWFTNRLHLLDLYFGLNGIQTTISYCEEDEDYKDLTYSGTSVYYPTYTDQTYQLNLNPDIAILQDLLTDNGNGYQNTNVDTFYIQNPEYTPTQIRQANLVLGQYILNSDVYNLISITPSGLQNVNVGGSKLWTYVSKLNIFLAKTTTGTGGSPFNLLTDNLENIVVTATNDDGTYPTCSSISFKTPAVKTIQLNSPGIAGTLTCTDLLSWPNLNSIDISGTQLSATIKDINVSSINISNVNNSTGTISISNCDRLSTLTMTDLSVKKLELSNLPIASYDLSGVTVEEATITAKESANASLTIEGNQTLTRLTLSNIKTLDISNCPKLSEIILIGNTTSITITGGNPAIVTNGSDTPTTGVIDLVNLASLKTVTIQNTSTTQINLPSGITLGEGALMGNKKLTYLNGSNIIATGNSTFRNCDAFTLRQSDLSWCDIKFTSTDLSYTFGLSTVPAAGVINLNTATHFAQYMVADPSIVTSIAGLFYNQVGIGSSATINSPGAIFTAFTSVVDAGSVFYNTGLNFISGESVHFGAKNMVLSNYIMPVASDGIRNIYISPQTLHKDYLPEECLSWPIGDASGVVYFLCDDTGSRSTNATDVIDLADYFLVSDYINENTTLLTAFTFNTNCILDCSNLFDTEFPNLTTLTNFGNGTNSLTLKVQLKEGQFENLKKLSTFRNNFNTSVSIQGDLLDLAQQFAWNDIYTNNPQVAINGGVNVYINYDDIVKLLDIILKTKATNINHLFENTRIYNPNSYDIELGSDNNVNTTITQAESLFTGATEYRNATTQQSLHISTNIFKNLPKLTNLSKAFQGTKLATVPGLNFFNKKESDGTYRQELSNISSIFKNAQFESIYKDEGITTTEQGDAVVNMTAYADSSYYTNSTRAVDAAKYYCLPKDFFYGVTTNGSVIEAFATESPESGIAGVIPEDIFQYNAECSKSGLFKNVYIIPKYIGKYTIDGTETPVYQYFPDGYTTNTSVSNCFNCSLQVPSSGRHIILSSDSIPDTIQVSGPLFAYDNTVRISGQNNTVETPLSFIGNKNGSEMVLGWDISKNRLSGTISNLFVCRYIAFMSDNLFTTNTYLSSNGVIAQTDSNYAARYSLNMVGYLVHSFSSSSDVVDKYGSSSLNRNAISRFLKFPYTTGSILSGENTANGLSFIGPPSSLTLVRYVIHSDLINSSNNTETDATSQTYYSTAGNISE